MLDWSLRLKISHAGAPLGILLAYCQLQGGQAAMMNLVRQMRGMLSLNDLFLIMSIALSIPLRLAVPLAVEVVSRRINIHLTFGD
jgi:hypothetical protein